ncbi:MAG: sodium/proton-translocating pyrophosphatase, partial [Bacteroidales bacterium]|nr:sodium/proton-translocating pyrophosphatase [Bacteroidales bacterium]
MNSMYLILGSAVIAIAYGLISVRKIYKLPAGNERMQEIARAIQEGAKAFLNRQYRAVALVAAILFVVLGFALGWM